MKNKNLSRRSFLKGSAMLSAGTGMMLAGTAPSFALPKVNTGKIDISASRKALVFIMLDGGNDSYNMLVPTSASHYQDYRKTRSNLAIDRRELLKLKDFTDKDGRTFGVHASMPEVQRLFNRKKLSFIANIGPMIEPVAKKDFYSGAARLPVGLLSHSDQFKHWQTSRPDLRMNRGWFGSFADVLQPGRVMGRIPMNVSLAGSNIMQNGVLSTHYSINDSGSVGLIVNEESSPLNDALLKNFEALLGTNYADDPFKQNYLELTREAQSQHEVFARAVEDIEVNNSFSDTPLSQQLRMVAKTIKAADKLKTPQQTFFIRYIGWDHHDELLNTQKEMLRVVSKALGEFQEELEDMGVADQVITFTGSDFGRTLTSNGNGTDHGWGGNTIVMGNPIDGGKVFGQYPDLNLGKNNPLDAGDGVLIPTTTTEQLYAPLAQWFGVKPEGLPVLFPNMSNFGKPEQLMLPVLRS